MLAGDDALHEDAGHVDPVGLELAEGDDLLRLDDGDLRRPCTSCGEKFRAVLRKTQLPQRSALWARTMVKSACSGSSNT
jgi:hypothetical protein